MTYKAQYCKKHDYDWDMAGYECYLCAQERKAHRETHDAIARNDGGIDPQSMAARLIAREYGLNGDPTSRINERLNNGNE